MSALAVAAAVLMGASSLAWTSPAQLARTRTRRVVVPPETRRPLPGRAGAIGFSDQAGMRAAALTACVAVMAMWLAAGPAAAVSTAVPLGCVVLVFRRRDRAAGLIQAEIGRQLPRCADLLAACLEAGAAPIEALEEVAAVSPEPLARRLGRTAGALRLGADVTQAWSTGPSDPLDQVARAFARAADSGAPLAEALGRLSQQRRRELRWAAEAATRRAGVLALLPLLLCFLPAFVLVGIVPVVLALAAEVVGGAL